MARPAVRPWRLVPFVVIWLLVSNLPRIPSLASPGEPGSTTRSTSRHELTTLRTEDTKFFIEPDGTQVAEVHAGPIHYRAPDGRWLDIDPTLIPSDRDGFAWRNRAGAFSSYFSPTGRASQLVLLQDHDVSVSFALAGMAAASSGTVSADTMTYPDALPGVDLAFKVTRVGVKELIILKRRPLAPLWFRFPLQLSGLSLQTNASGVTALVDAHGNPRYAMPPAWMEDSAVNARSGDGASADVRTDVDSAAGAAVLTLSPDQAWLADPTRVYPVTIDPSINRVVSDDTFVQSNDNSSNVSGLHLRSGTWDGGATKARALFHFDGLVAALAGKDIVDVDFNVFESLSPSCTPSQADLYRVAESWQDDVVWSTQPSVVTPPVASLSAAKGHSADCPADWVTFSSDALTTTVKNWADGTWLNHGFRIRATSETDDNGYKKFYSLENVNDPYLRVAYATASTQPPPPTDGVQLLPPSSLHSNGADIEWTPYASSSGVPFEKYEVHRSTTLGFTPSSGTLLATIDDVSINSYSDTSAAPGKAFTYKVVANSLPSNEQTVTLPPDGQATKVVQPGPEGSQTYLNYSSQLANCINEGAEDTLRVGTDTTEKYRSALQFELTDVPADASVNSATLSLWHPSTVPSQITIDAHQMTSDWDEGAGLGSCTGEGATWQERRSDLDWDSPGGDFDPTQVASLSDPAAEPAGWDAFDVTSLVRDWTAGEASNLGVLLKASDDTSMTSSHYVRYNSDDSTNAALRPKLVINYSEDTHAAAPSVSVTSPVQDERVSGSAVTLAAAASDDRRVERVDFLVDGTQRGSATSEPFAVSWDSTTVPDGTHTIAARATDDAGNTSTSDAVQVRVANTAPPTADFTTPTSGSVVKGNVPVTVRVVADPATTITKVEFYADGYLFATRTAGPMYDASWDTLDPAHPAYDGTHELVAKAYDATGSVTTSPSTQVTVANTAGTPYRADINPAVGAIPQTMDFDPNAESQHSYPVDVTVTNQSADTWLTTQTFLTYSWVDPSDNSVVVDGLTSGIRIPLDTLLAGQSETLHATVAPPPLADGVARSRFILRFDLFKQLIGLPIGIATTQQSSASTGTGTPCCNGPTTFSSQGNPPSDNPVVVNNTLMETAMGLERYYGHDQEDLGAGMTNLVNVSNGNSVLAWRPWSEPGKGLSTVLSISYNSLEDRTESPIGNNFSLSISSLTRFGLPLQVHPPSGNTHPYGYIDLVDADGTPLRFEGTASGTVYKEPPGVHLYLRRFSTTDVNRRWALTRPDGVTFFYDADGYPTEVEDHNQNRLKFALAKPDPGDDPGPPTKHVVQVTDQANRSFDIIYFTHADVADPHIRGKIKRITDHSGHALEFTYYNDGNLLKITEKGGKTADGAVVADRSFVFTYTTSNSAGPAIPNPAERANPNPNTRDQSTQLYSVRDPRRHETTFRYITSGKDNRKLLSRTNRVGSMTSFAYDIYGRITTVTKPLNRITSYAYDTDGKVTSLTDPESRTTWLEWTQDRQVKKVIEPTGKYSAYDYNANGYLLAETDQLSHTTKLEYQNDPVDGGDDQANWTTEPGRERRIGHLSLLLKLTKPLGVVSAAPDDYQWDFEYDDRNLSKVIQPYADDGKRYFTTYTHNPDGTVESTTDPNGHTTTFGYDDNGLVTRVTQQSQGLDQNGNPRIPVTTFGYDADGELLWVQDPNHQKYSNSKTTTYRTYFYYDAFHRLVWQSTPRHTATGDPLIWMSTAYDPNDNVVAQTDAAQGAKFAKGPTSTSSYDDMDQVIAAVNPGSSSGAQTTKIDYDAAGRISTVTRPNGVASNVSKDFQTDYDYDLLDRVKNETTYLVNRTTGALDETVRTSFCYDFAGDLTRVLSPRATNRDCAAPTPQPFTTSYEYDPAHKRVRVVDGLGHDQKVSYDANDRVSTTEDAEHASTTYTYDQRDKTITLVEPFQTTPARTVTTKYVYDGAGNVTQLISPRAWDAAGGHAPFTNFVTTYHYNDLNQLTRIDLPRDADTIQAYVHRDYDLNGNLKTVTLPVTQSAPGSVPDSSKTDLTYLDPGWILASNDNVNPKVHFDYDPRGLQTVRVPEVKGSAGKLDTAHKVVWKYYPNRLLQSMKDAKSNAETYKYDLDDNLLEGKDSIGVTTSDESPMSIVVDPNTGYDTLDRLAKVKFKKNAESTWKSTNYVYDPNSNVERRIDNATEGQAGTGTIHTFTYDGADWLKRQIDDNSTGSDNADDQVIDNEWWPTGREKKRTIYRGNASTTPKQITNWTWYPNGLLQTLNTTTGDGTTVESHDVKYTEDSNVYVDGNRTRDTFKLDGPSDRTDQCRPSGTGCTAKWYYDGRDRLTRYDDGHGNVTTYGLDEIGNVKTETRGSQVTRYDYNGAQLKTKTDPSEAVHNYFYDNLGNLNCIMAAGYSRCPTGSDKAGLEVDYGYDPLNRMQSYAAYAGLTKTDSATYAYDALDRLTKESEIHQAGGSRTSSFTYMGLTSLATQEAQTGSSPTTKSYSYDAYGHRMSMTDSASSKTYSYGYDVHGSVSLLRDELNGSTKASYGYDAYGNTDAALTKGDTSPTNPTNPYRYQAARFDTGSQTTDMGARRFASNSLHFLQQDLFQGALDDLSLTSDPLTNNRYALAGGNPVQFKEWDGHVPRFDGGGMASFNPNPPQSSANTEPHRSFWGHIGGFFKGFAEQGADFVKGVGSMAWGGVKWVGACTSFNETNCAHGLNTAATAVSNLRHPTRVWRAYTASIRSDWRRGKKDEAAGRVGFEVLTFVIAAAKGVKAVKALRGAGAVDAATLGTAEGVSSQVIVDTNAVFNRAGVEAALNAGETPVITRTTSAELRNLVARGPLKMPRYAGELDGIEDVMDVNTRINIRGMLEGIRGGEPGLFGDGSIGATAINRGLPVITDDRNFASALEQLGVEVRRPV